jgi:hypothetical protein
LDYAAGSNDVGCRHPINFAPFHFLEEAGHKKGFDSELYCSREYRHKLTRDIHSTQSIAPYKG